MQDEPRAWGYYATALAASLLPALLSGFLVWQVRSADYASVGKAELGAAAAIAADLDNSFEGYDSLLKSIGRQYVESLEGDAEEQSGLVRRLEEELAERPFDSRIFIADSAGRFVLGGGAFKVAPAGASVADRQYFERARRGERGLMFEGPHKAKFGDEWVIVLARRLEDGRGAFLGVVAGGIPVEFFRRRLAQIEQLPEGLIVFRSLDGARIAEHSHDPDRNGAPGGVEMSPVLATLLRGGADRQLFRSASPLDHVERLSAFQRLSAAPYFVLVGAPTAFLDRPWRLLAAELGLLCLGVTTAALWTARRLHGSAVSLRRERSLLKQRVAERTQELEDSARELSAVLRSVVTNQEEDRKRIARDLHDRLGQYLAAMNLKLGALERAGAADAGALGAGLADLKALTATVGSEASRLAFDLRPTALDDIGLESAVRHLIDDWAGRSGLRFDLHLALGGRRLPPEVETTLYRVLQEGVTNIVKHARAKTVGVTLRASRTEVVMTVEDDGVGFDLEKARASSRLGLVGMRERLAGIGGRLEIEAAPGRGTALMIRIPLDCGDMRGTDDGAEQGSEPRVQGLSKLSP